MPLKNPASKLKFFLGFLFYMFCNNNVHNNKCSIIFSIILFILGVKCIIHSSKKEHIILFVNINWYEDKIKPLYMCMYVPYLL